jgi:hypothetical protein
MLEKWFNAGQKTCGKQSRKVLQWAGFVPTGIWIVILAFLLVGARPVWGFFYRPAHLDDITYECGSFGAFYGLPMSDRTGTHIAYAQGTQKGIGIFLYNGVTRESQLLYAYSEEKLQRWRFRFLLPWTPDDTSFAFTCDPEDKIAIYRPDSGKVSEISCPSEISAQLETWASWLTDDSLVYLGKQLECHLIKKQEDGHWEDTTRFISPEIMKPNTAIMAISSNRIAWREDTTIWMLDLGSSNAPLKLFEAAATNPALTEVKGIAYSADTGQFLINCRGKKGESLWQLNSSQPSIDNLSLIKSASSIIGGRWINGGKGYAYMSQNGKNKVLVVQSDLSAQPVTLFSAGNVTGFTTSGDGKRLFIQGVTSNEFRPAIWQYELDSATLQCVVPSLDHPWHYAKSVAPRKITIALPSGKNSFEIYLPPDFDRHKHQHYPLVFASPYFLAFREAAPNCGVICAYVERRDNSADAVADWEKDILAVSKYLANNPYVDSKRIFLSAVSAETASLNGMSTLGSGQWRGLLLLSPTILPDPKTLVSGSHPPKVFISAGSLDGTEARIRQYQVEAGKIGVKVDVFIKADASHYCISRSAMFDRLQTMMDFIFGN